MKPRLFVFLLVAAVLVVLVTIASACGDGEEGAAITVDDLAGIWERQGGSTLVQFNEDGTFRAAQAAASLEDNPIDLGEFRLEGTLLTFITSESSVCPSAEGVGAAYQVELTEEGDLRFVLQGDDPCAERTRDLEFGPWRRTSP